MWTSLTVSLCLALGLTRLVSVSCSALPVDLEGSGYDGSSSASGSGSGNGSEQGDVKKTTAQPNSKGTEKALYVTPFLNFDWTHEDGRSRFVFGANSSFFKNKDMVAAGIAGGVVGVALAAALAAAVIYKSQKKDHGGYILGHQRASGGDDPNREEVVVTL